MAAGGPPSITGSPCCWDLSLMAVGAPTFCGHLAGRVAPVRTVAIDRSQLRLFAKAIGETDPVYSDDDAARAAGHPAIPAPPTFAFCLERTAAVEFDWLEEIGVPACAMLHGEQAFDNLAPMYAGDVMTLESRVSDIGVRGGGRIEFVTFETDARNQYGTLCSRQWFTVLVLTDRVARSGGG